MLVWRRVILPVVFVLVLAAAAAALVKLAFFPDVAEAAPPVPGASVSDPVVPVERGTVVNELSLEGTIARDESYAVRSEINGVVTKVHVAEGASVTKGQVLFTVKQDQPVKSIDIVAPEAGDVSALALVKGQQSSVGGEVLTLLPSRYHVRATVQPAQLYRLVNAPDEATVTITGGPAPFVCTGVRVQVSDEGTASVRCGVPIDQTVFAGLPAKLDLALGKVDDALVIPVTAVQGGAGSGVVWADAGDGAEPEKRTVKLGVNDGETVEILEGLAEGDQIRQYVPGFAAPVEENCWDDGSGGQMCETGTSW
ncbi:multidrug efflux pump subunit AcrA (membrane-fusion protein) [Microbacterium sp. W4I4]|uniref:efflux RND transporter periplasmic adaptor subunit n=1 Tax=Microbacterium sp. W4I4 TaxID=3042295 RepID=UPI00278AFA79|nr:HlyD family efflux transporter periplasmic adaptor subunit [Microbacterium sp. W4I4]MDQ0613299.1 multidrug efflux pump subunit AcrA (membrane-fusion protein) [Microbacterium sp. W4I4]